jgi:hypothetical protein
MNYRRVLGLFLCGLLIALPLSACGTSQAVQTTQSGTSPPVKPSAEPTSGLVPTTNQAPAATNSQTPSALAPADRQEPVSGACASFDTSVVTITINPDTPSPRCAKVTATQRLTVINKTSALVQVKLAQFAVQLPPGESQTFDVAFGSYLAPGVHSISMSNYGEGAGAELWLAGS